MPGLRILLTSCSLGGPSGAVMYVHDVARELLARGHQPFVYSPSLGEVAQRLSVATIGAVSDLKAVHFEPDIIHAQHSLEALKVLLHFPRTPAIYVCHDWNAIHDTPPKLPRIGKYVAVDDTVRDRLVLVEGIPETDIEVIFNGVDLRKFQPRGPLPEKPQRALAISNYLQQSHVDIIRAACQAEGIQLDTAGPNAGGACLHPEQMLGRYDLVFAKGRCAWEALAVGVAVIVCDIWGVGSLVTLPDLAVMRRANFGRRLLQKPLQTAFLREQIARYNAADASEVCRQIRASSGVEDTVDQLLSVYQEVIPRHRAAPADPALDMQAAAEFLHSWSGLSQPAPVPPATFSEGLREELRLLIREELRQGVSGETVNLREELRLLLREELTGDTRQAIRLNLSEQLRLAKGATGVRKLVRSIKKRLQRIYQRREAA